ncbi:hypothetical protein SARC_04401 [Sphaeroforma arctica JP610]|uniref:Uncharacterized protein n=1 Tax=Sphaeroforma arctica JP610 TaxID=667725 RepID=A0A0L0G3A0_9EUKA|nr:hypothetical protein SARC_04401 [Sphaeroforma arctica JP610]KNC83349.1 hypothetical protein SARC_04401 [Sphaeroforma arctica JP610]|eukprot:XP_014157251.1 hypothetical protein SARC_04401 [Sphaeroforma arctica JP610]
MACHINWAANSARVSAPRVDASRALRAKFAANTLKFAANEGAHIRADAEIQKSLNFEILTVSKVDHGMVNLNMELYNPC